MGKSAEISLEKRAEINILMNEGMSQKQIADRLGISQSAVSKILKRIINDGMFTPRPRSGRPRNEDKFIIRKPLWNEIDEEEKEQRVQLAKEIVREIALKARLKETGMINTKNSKLEEALIAKAKRFSRNKKKNIAEKDDDEDQDQDQSQPSSFLEHTLSQEFLMDETSNNTPEQYENSKFASDEHSMHVQIEDIGSDFMIKLENNDLSESCNAMQDIQFQNNDSNKENFFIKEEPFNEEEVVIKVENVRNNIELMDDDGSCEDEKEVITSVTNNEYFSRNIASEEQAPRDEVEFLQALQRDPLDEIRTEQIPEKTKFRSKKNKPLLIPDTLTVESLEEVLQMSKALSHKIYEIDSVFNRSVSFKRALEAAMGPYKEIYKRLKNGV